ncbi:hypothetical protein DAEQUDRAFT_729827 [Daedalea quercina L-15889]|uniref:Uncharacterized protein n=1 Tax=Daedalea quercina L-15889 TaxID=1314783 RepID=A0A165NE76_9APHY|nr:hypothetical protein DAEQUDRAFT_729827 [Daedalea quercina L-15889]
MQLRNFIEDGELCGPTMFDANREVCFIVARNGISTGVAFRRESDIESFVRGHCTKSTASTRRP